MTDLTNMNTRAVVLAVCMVLAIVGAPFAFTGAVAADNGDDADVDGLDGFDRIWQGQTISIDEWEDGDEIELREDTGDSSNFISEYSVPDDGEFILETDDLDAGDYYFVDDDGNEYPVDGEEVAPFEIVEQTLDVEMDDSVANDGDSDFTEAEFEADSNRGAGNYDLAIVEADGELTGEEIADIFDGAVEADDDTAIMAEYDEETVTADFNGVDEGTYEFEVVVTDSTAADIASIDVVERGSGEAVFTDSSVTTQQGGVAEITVEFTDAQTDATVQVGDEDEVGYEAELYVDADSDVEEVTILANTYKAGVDEPESAYMLAEDTDAELTVREETELSEPESNLLAEANYQLDVAIGDELDSADDVGTLSVTELNIEEAASHITSPENAGDLDDAEAVEEAVEEGLLTERDIVANGDAVVYSFDSSSLEGALASYGTDEKDAFEQAVGEGVFTFALEQTDETTGSNTDSKLLDLSETDYEVVYDGEDGTHYVVIDTDDMEFENSGSGVEDGDAYNLAVSLSGDRFVDDDEEAEEYTVTAFTEVEERMVEFDDPLTAYVDSEATITAETNTAPGSEADVRVQSVDSNPSFLVSSTAVVDEDGYATAEFDFSEYSAGDEFEVAFTDANGETYEAEGTLEDEPEPAAFEFSVVDAPEDVEPGETYDLNVDIENVGDSEGETEYEITADDEVIGEGDVTVEAGDVETVTGELVVDEDAEGEISYNVEVDGESESGTITVQADGGSDDGTADGTDGAGDDDVSGLGFVVALAAIGVALVVGYAATGREE